MPEPKDTYEKIQNIRVRNLEQQIHLMRAELQRIREGLLPQKDIIRLTSLADKLKELNDVLKDLRNHYNMEKIKQYEKKYSPLPTTNVENLNKANYQKEESKQLSATVNIFSQENIEKGEPFGATPGIRAENVIKSREETNESYETCKKLMNESQRPSSILGNYLIKLQDFRTDPELRRQRLERKEKEKLQQLRMRNDANITENQQSFKEENVEEAKNNFVEQSNFASDLPNSTTENLSHIQNQNIVYRCSNTDNNYNDSDTFVDKLIIRHSLKDVVHNVIRDMDRDTVALTVVLETDQLYHVSVSTTSSGKSLGCFFSTEDAIQEAKIQNLFKEFLTLFVINAENSIAQKDRVLGHSFEFIKLDI